MTVDELAAERHLEGIRVPMRDGRVLCTDVLLPEGDGPWPASLVRTPYGRWQEIEPARALVGDGVAMVLQDVAGRFGSEGRFGLFEPDGTDAADTIAWIASQPWCDGRVAMRGFSYRGLVQWHAALEHPPALRAIAPLMSPAWWDTPRFRSLGGPVHLAMLTHWLPRQAAEADGVPTDLMHRWYARSFEPDAIMEGDRISEEKLLVHPGLSRFPLADPWPVEGSAEFEPVWRAVFERPPTRIAPGAPARGADRIDVPSLTVAGWYDANCADAIACFRHIRRVGDPAVRAAHRLLVLPLGHGDPLTAFPAPDAFRFGLHPDHDWGVEWLLDRGRALRDLAPVTYYVLGAGRWEEADDWPPRAARSLTLFLDPVDRSLREDAPATRHEVGYAYDPRRPVPSRGGAALKLPVGPMDQHDLTGGARDDVVSFTGAPLAHPLVLAGPVQMELFAASSARDTDFTAKLLDVAPDGRALSICDGIVRGRYRNGVVAELLTPGAIERYTIACGDIAYRIPAGHRLRVDISSSNFPLYDRNPNTGAAEGTDHAGDVVVAHQRVQGGGRYPSNVRLMVMP